MAFCFITPPVVSSNYGQCFRMKPFRVGRAGDNIRVLYPNDRFSIVFDVALATKMNVLLFIPVPYFRLSSPLIANKCRFQRDVSYVRIAVDVQLLRVSFFSIVNEGRKRAKDQGRSGPQGYREKSRCLEAKRPVSLEFKLKKKKIRKII